MTTEATITPEMLRFAADVLEALGSSREFVGCCVLRDKAGTFRVRVTADPLPEALAWLGPFYVEVPVAVSSMRLERVPGLVAEDITRSIQRIERKALDDLEAGGP